MECAALRSPLVTQSRRTSSGFGFGKRRVRPLCHLMVRQQTGRNFIVVGGLQMWESRSDFQGLSLDSCHLQAIWFRQDGRTVRISAGEDGPCHACQLVGQRHSDDVVVTAR